MSALAYTLNRKVTIEQRSADKDPDYGTQVDAWVPVAANIWAEVQDVLPSKSEAVKQGIRIGTQQKRVRIRYRAGITADMRVTIHGTADTVCQIVGGPAEMMGRRLLEMVVEAYSS